MRTGILTAVATCLLLLTACGGKETGGGGAKLADLQARYKELNGQLAEKSPAWQEVKNAVIPARSIWKKAKGTDEEAGAKQAFEEAQAAATDVINQENELKGRIRDLKDEIRRLGGTP